MPEHLRALVVIVILAATAFFIVRAPTKEFCAPREFQSRVKLWFGLTFLAFFSFSFWLYAAFSVALILALHPKTSNRLAAYCLLFFLLPLSGAQVPGLGLINYLIELNHLRLLTLALLLPVFITLVNSRSTDRFGKFWPDKLVSAYLVLIAVLSLTRSNNITNTVRLCVELGLDIFIPYYVASRALGNIRMYKDVLFSYLVAALVISLIGFFEYSRHWLLYSALNSALGLDSNYSLYLGRSGSLRAMATTGQSIVLGYAIAIAVAIYIYLQPDIRSRTKRWIIGLALFAGMVSSLARGPWLGCVVILVVHTLLMDRPAKRLGNLIMFGSVAGMAMLMLPGSDKLINLIPGLGKTEMGSIDYRAQLFENASIVIGRNPLLGSADFLKTPEMEAMRQGQGIIDIVNSYIAITLSSGFIGVGLFIGFFCSILFGIRKTMKKFKRTDEAYRLGQFFIAAIVGTLVIIGTVSSITFVPAIYWLLAGLGVGYIRLFGGKNPALLAAEPSEKVA